MDGRKAGVSLMQKRRPLGDGAVLLGGEHAIPTRNRPILQASPAAKLRLQALLWTGWLTLGGVRP